MCAMLADDSRRLLVVDKARQMRATWEAAFHLLHKAMFSGPWEIGVKGKYFEESRYILFDRIVTLWSNLPDYIQAYSPFIPNKVDNKITFPRTGSVIRALGEKHRATQGKQWSDFLLDECAYMRDFPHVFGGLLPTKLRLVCMSTPFGDVPWKCIVKDLEMKLTRGAL